VRGERWLNLEALIRESPVEKETEIEASLRFSSFFSQICALCRRHNSLISRPEAAPQTSCSQPSNYAHLSGRRSELALIYERPGDFLREETP